MKKSHSLLVTSAFAGLLLGAGTSTLASCSKADSTQQQAANDKHACATLNQCAGKGGCKTGNNGCKTKNSCAGKGGCATVAHECATKNACKGQGGCKGTAGKNECAGKGGCKVPVQKH